MTDCNFPIHRIPDRNWLSHCVVAVVFMVFMTTAFELYWRAKGERPSVSDSAQLWAMHRTQVDSENKQALVVLGASRAQIGIDPNILHEKLPGYEIHQLAVASAGSALRPLEDLAADQFSGIAICAVIASQLEPSRWNDQQKYVSAFRENRELFRNFEFSCRAFMESSLVSMRPRCGLRAFLSSLRNRGAYTPSSRTQKFDRHIEIDYSRVLDIEAVRESNLDKIRRTYETRNFDVDAWTDRLKKLEAVCNQIKTSGGQVVLLRMPTSGPRVELDAIAYPRSEYWDELPTSVPSAVCVHSFDEPSLSRFECGDMSHLGRNDAREFTASLVDVLQRLGVARTDR